MAGYDSNLAIRLIQNFGVSEAVANHLAATYGGRAVDVLSMDINNNASTEGNSQKKGNETTPMSTGPRLLHLDFPYLEAEVR